MSGFRATGLFPYDPQQPLSKLPAESPSEASTSSVLNESVLEFLQEARGQTSSISKRKRGKKLYPAKKLNVKKVKTGKTKKILY